MIQVQLLYICTGSGLDIYVNMSVALQALEVVWVELGASETCGADC